MEPTSFTPQASGLRRYHIRVLIVTAVFFVVFAAYVNSPPSTFSDSVIVTIKSGDTLNSVAKDLKTKRLIRSTTMLRGVVMLSAGEQKIAAGDYYFAKPVSTRTIASRFMTGDFGLSAIRVTIPEGLSMSQIGALLSPKFGQFSESDFMKFSPVKEGRLFPDTYFFMPNVKAEKVIEVLQKNFEEKIKAVESEILAFGKSEDDVVIMASILEEEGQTPEDWRVISGILWKRIKIGMPLQVDASLGYVTGRSSSELTKDDLKITSAYNTYVHKGLPPTPISNPGLETIVAAITPIETPYFYYLSDKDGVIHYAATFADHIKNREKYLK